MTQGFQRFTKRYVSVSVVLIGLAVVSSILLYSGCGMVSRPNTPANPSPTPTPTPTPTPDRMAPSTAITSPTAGATVVIGSQVLITGTARDFGGGSVVRVEVSVDGGATWNQASGTDSWSYLWTVTSPSNGSGDVTISSRAIDNSDNRQDPPSEIKVFVVDRTPPTVTSFSPVDGAKNVSQFANVIVTFSEAMDLMTVNNSTVELRDPSRGLIQATVSPDANSRIFTLDPTAPLKGGIKYTAVVKGGEAGVKDLAGNPLAADLTWTFTTVTPPRVLSITPARGDTNISLDVTPAATFSQALDPTTVNSSTVALTDETTTPMPINSRVLYVRSVGRILLVPDEPLLFGQTYTMTLKGGPDGPRIANLAGTPLTSDEKWSFTTASSDTGSCDSVSFNVTPRIDLPRDDYGARLLVNDFNQDSIPDLVAARFAFGRKGVSFFPGASDGGFGSPVDALTLSGDRAFITDVTAGDFNGDGKLDIVAVSEDDFNAWSVWVILNNGAGGFASPTRFPSSKVLRRATVADFNSDGKTDLVVAIIDDSRTADGLLFLNDGTGSFEQPQEILRTNSIFSHDPQSVTPTDIDGDGNLDLVFLYKGVVAIHKGNGAGGFTPQPEIDSGVLSAVSAIGDFNGDGRPDLLAVEPEGSQDNLRVYLNDGTGRFGAPVSTPSGERLFNVQGAIAEDFDGDGKTDVVIRTISGFNSKETGIKLFTATTDGGFSEPISYHPSVVAPAMATSDFNHDGLPDILSLKDIGSLTIVINRGGGFNAPRGVAYSRPGVFLDQYIVGDLESVDINGDGALDLVIAGAGLSDAAIMFGAGRNKFSDPVLISSGVTDGLPVTIELQDFNNDGKLDMAVVYANTRSVVALLGDGQGGFTPSATINIGVNVNKIVSGDFNNDGNLDLVVRGIPGGLALYLGDGQGGFTQSAAQIGVSDPVFHFTAR